SLPIAPSDGRALRTSNPDLLLVHEPSLLAATSLLGRGGPLDPHRTTTAVPPIIVWWHSDIVRQRALAHLYGPILHSLLRRAHRVIVATPHHVASSSVLGRYADKCVVIPYGIDESRFGRLAQANLAVSPLVNE